MKLKKILKNFNLNEVYGFPAFQQLKDYANQQSDDIAILSTLSPADMLMKNIKEYYYPVIPRGSRFNTAEEIIDADLEVITVYVENTEEISREDFVTIVSRHPATIEIIKKEYPNNEIFTGNVTVEEIQNKKVIGTLPADYAAVAAVYKPCVIENFNAAIDNDLSGEEFEKRFKILPAVKVQISK